MSSSIFSPPREARRIGRLRTAAAFTFALSTAAFGVSLVAPADAHAEGAQDTAPVTEFTLENGMRGVVIQDHRAPVVTHMVWYKVGSSDEPPGKSGIAHFLEHLMFKGTDELELGEFSKIIAANGGQDNAFTSRDYTGYFQRIASDRLDLVMKLEADRMIDLEFPAEEADTERNVVLEERSTRTDNNPEGQFSEDFTAALFMNHAYGRPVIGWRHEIEELTKDDVFDFYRRYYTPRNATLVVAGDVTPEEVIKLAERHYGPIEGRPIDPIARPTEPPHRAERRIRMADARVRQPYVSRSYLTPSYVSGDLREAAAMRLFSEVFGGAATSRLDEALVRGDAPIAISVGSYYSGMARDHTSFTMFGVPREGVSLEQMEQALDKVLAEFIAEGPSEDELARAKNGLIAQRLYMRDSQSSMARLYGLALTIGMTVDQVQAWPSLIESITAEEVMAAGARLDKRASVTGWLERGEETSG